MRYDRSPTGPIVLGVILAGSVSFLPVGVGLAALVILGLFAGVAKAIARKSDKARWYVVASYSGVLVGMIVAFVIATRP